MSIGDEWWVMSDDRIRVKHAFWLFSIMQRLVAEPKRAHLFIIDWKTAVARLESAEITDY